MPTPVVFIHGLWLHADSWKPWLELFRAADYDPIAPRWPGEPAAEANALHAKYHIPAPGKPLFEAAPANVFPNTPAKVNTKAVRGPLFITKCSRTGGTR